MTTLLVILNVTALVLLIAFFLKLTHERGLEQKRFEMLTEQIDNATDASAKIAEVQAFCHYACGVLNTQIESARRARDKVRANELLELRNRVEALEARVVHRTIRLLDNANGSEKNRRKKQKTRHTTKKS